jgi:hypothetical protein
LCGENYANLKSQCYFKLSEFVESNKVYVNCEDPDIKEKLIQDLEQQKQKDPDKDGKLAVIGKELIKENIGRSPDYSDALMMRMYFEVGFVEEFDLAPSLDIAF